MAARRINDVLRGINLYEVKPLLLRDDGNGDPEPIEVCTATLADWNLYVKSDSQVMKPKFMEWHDNAIWIVEYPGAIHAAAAAAVISAMALATGTGNRHLMPLTDPHSERPPAGEPNIEPDGAFGPRDHVGAVLPPGLTDWLEYHTVKVEVGVSQRWPSLNRKAALWKGRVGVEFVLSIRLSPAIRVCEYRLEQRMDGRFPDDANRAPILPIDANAVLEFDAHQLLGFPGGAALPVGFNDPVRIDLFGEVELIRTSGDGDGGDGGGGGGDEDEAEDEDGEEDEEDDDDEDDGGQGGGGLNTAQQRVGTRRPRPSAPTDHQRSVRRRRT